MVNLVDGSGIGSSMPSLDDLAMPFLLMFAFRGLADAVNGELDEAGFPGVRSTHGYAMQAIGAGCTSGQLAERLGVSKQAAAKTTQMLVDMDFVARERSTTDRRLSQLTPTRRGQEMLRLSAEAFLRVVSDWRARAGDDAIDTALRALIYAPRPRRGPTDLSGWV
jgi:DNA-binding MarR family transcriptional regulator